MAKTIDVAKPYVVFARRFRPQTFADVAGQTAVTAALRQALASGRLAQAYLLCGPRGVGKTSLARIFAKACNCLNGSGPNGMAEEPCNTCSACVSIQEGSSLDVIEMDAATNRGIEEVRSLRENVGIAPANLRYKVYIIDEVHMLTREAWNAFLKTLEEPPAHVKFIFATTDPNDVPETILSRCQRFDLRRISLSDIVKRLLKICVADRIEYEEAALSRIAGLAKGGLRDAEGMLDQAVNLAGGKITDAIIRDLSGAAPDEIIFEMLQSCAAGKTADVLAKSHAALEAGADPDDILAVLSDRLRSAVLAKVCGLDSPLLEGQTHLQDAYAALGKVLSEDQCLMMIQLFTNARRQMRDAAQTRLPLEVALIRASRARDLIDLGKLASALESGAGQVPAAHGAGSASPPGNQEGARPNLQGRPAADNASPAAFQNIQKSKTTTPSPQDLWPRVVELIKAQKGAAILASALSHATVAFRGEKSELSFATDSTFYRDALNNPQNQLALQNVLTEVYGRSWSIRMNEPAPSASPAGSIAARSPASGAATVIPAGFTVRDVRTSGVSAHLVSPSAPLRVPVARAPGQDPAKIATPAEAPKMRHLPVDEPSEYEDTSYDEVDVGSLPLTLSVPVTESDAPTAPSDDGENLEPTPIKYVLPPPPMVATAAAGVRMSGNKILIDSTRVENHPMVQAILKSTGGLVLDVSKSKKKDGDVV